MTPDLQQSPLPNAAGEYDLLPFLRGSGEVYQTWNSWTAGERMQTQLGPGGIFYQCKNSHWEELGATQTAILRGLDTSPGNGQVYILSNPDGAAGAVWAPRWLKPGTMVARTARVTFLDLKSGTPIPSKTYVDKTWLRFVALHLSWVSPGGLITPYVIELEGYTDQNGAPGRLFERYFYGLGLGLVGWQGGNGMQLKMGISGRPGNLPDLARLPLLWYAGLKLPAAPPAVTIAADDARWRTAKALTRGGVAIVRAEPSLNAVRLDGIQVGGEWIEHIPPEALTPAERAYAEPAGDVPWYAVKTLKRIVGWTRSDVVDIDFPAQPIPADAVTVSKGKLDQLRTQLEELTTLVDEDNQRRQAITLKLADANATFEELMP